MLPPKDFFSLRSNPINLIGILLVLYGLIMLSWGLVATGMLVWVAGVVFHTKLPGSRKKS